MTLYGLSIDGIRKGLLEMAGFANLNKADVIL